MSVLLSCWVLGIFLILIWCSLQHPEEPRPSSARQESTKDHLEYIPISPALLREWAVQDEHLMIMDLRPRTQAGADFDSIPGSLRIPPGHLRSYFCYLPPNTRLVLHDKAAATRLDSGAESILLMTGIQAVYVLEESTGAWNECVSGKGGRSSYFPGGRPDSDVPFEDYGPETGSPDCSPLRNQQVRQKRPHGSGCRQVLNVASGISRTGLVPPMACLGRKTDPDRPEMVVWLRLWTVGGCCSSERR
jgi:rhodanese-related sulfurtransferase